MHQSVAENILVFDSGLGGLSLIPEIRSVLPASSLIYLADNALFPYGDLTEEELTSRLIVLFRKLLSEKDITAAVIACNTASTVILDVLRAEFTIPFVGTVPAIKPACMMTQSGFVSVLATPGTVNRAYTQKLVEDFAGDVDVHLHGSAGLASLAEEKLMGFDVDMNKLSHELAPAFKDLNGSRTDVIVLGCTHYPLLKDEMNEAALWPVTFLDTSEAIARRLHDIVAASRGSHEAIEEEVMLTAENPEFSQVFKPFGFDKISLLSV